MATAKAAAKKDGQVGLKQGAPAVSKRGAAETVEREVSRSDVTLLQAIAAGDVPKPDPLSYNAWLQWRKRCGKRPVTKTDGGTTSSAFERDLRIAVLKDLYGDNFEELVQTAEEEAAEKEERLQELREQMPKTIVPISHRMTLETDYSTKQLVARAESASRAGPLSHDATAKRAFAGIFAPGTGTPSWKSSEPGTPKSIAARMHQPFNPLKEELVVYTARFERMQEVPPQVYG